MLPSMGPQKELKAMREACQKGDQAVVEKFVLSDCEAVSWKLNVYGDTPLHFASLKGQTKIVSFLLSTCQDINPKNNFKMTPLHSSCASGHEEIVSLLLASNADLEVIDKDGETPLSKAKKEGKDKIVSLLEEEEKRRVDEEKQKRENELIEKEKKIAFLTQQLEELHEKTSDLQETIKKLSWNLQQAQDSPSFSLQIVKDWGPSIGPLFREGFDKELKVGEQVILLDNTKPEFWVVNHEEKGRMLVHSSCFFKIALKCCWDETDSRHRPGDVVLEEGEEVFILDRTSNKEWWKVFHQEKGECYLPSSCLFSNLE